MAKDLTSSLYDRQNILNNHYVLDQAETRLALGGLQFEGKTVFTKEHVINLFDVSEITIEKYLVKYADELKKNGYALLTGEQLRKFKDLFFGTVIHYGTKTTILGVFSFRAVLNLAMLLIESDNARLIRSRLLDIVLDVFTERTGSHTKFINQHDESYLVSAIQEVSYHRQFTDALSKYVKVNQWISTRFIDLIYQSI
ncbi:hypothetical protein [Thorsellia anophelis]|uniref:Uncharacterized protein n=1 Tax=Thorsellia anophelis DSM 18579 TaxID=1123402 RepID=A0A1H9ZQX1_9GAMM|nr:hypothetical protein [Thorsellia anophelis]SES83765.1 hypothetical protein SAMN02583745_00645 [Thorsellia anophelis DSM 18579]